MYEDDLNGPQPRAELMRPANRTHEIRFLVTAQQSSMLNYSTPNRAPVSVRRMRHTVDGLLAMGPKPWQKASKSRGGAEGVSPRG